MITDPITHAMHSGLKTLATINLPPRAMAMLLLIFERSYTLPDLGRKLECTYLEAYHAYKHLEKLNLARREVYIQSRRDRRRTVMVHMLQGGRLMVEYVKQGFTWEVKNS